MQQSVSKDTPTETATDLQLPTDKGVWLNPMLAIDYVTEGDEVTFTYMANDGKADTPTPSGKQHTVTATVMKIVEGVAGGIFLDPAPSKNSKRTYKLHLIEGGTVTGTPRYGSRSTHYGVKAKVNLTEDDCC